MMKKILLPAVLYAVVFTGHGQQTQAPVVLFSVGKKEITADEFIYLFRKNHPPGKSEYSKAKIDEYLDLFMKFKLKVEEARTRRMDTTAAFQREYNTYREELRKPYLPDNKLIDSLVSLTYQRLQEEVRASHILINVAADAPPADTSRAYRQIMELRNRVVNGESFEELAAKHSQDPTARLNKGDLGYFTAMQMVFPFEQAAYTTAVGEVSKPVRTRFGYHLILVKDRRPARGEVEVSHIMIRTGKGAEDEQAKNTIFDVYDRLQKGVKWEEACREFSEDEASKEQGGRLRPFGVGAMAGVPQFEAMAFSLRNPGDISDPFMTPYGWHILRLEAKIPVPPFEKLAASLRNRVSRDERAQISKKALREKMKKEFSFSENSSVKENVFALADSSLNAGDWNALATAPFRPAILFTIRDRNVTVAEFDAFVRRNQKQGSAPPAKYISQLYDQFVDEQLALVLEEKIKREQPDYAWLLNEYYEGILLFEIMEREVWNKAAADSAGQLSFYNTNQGRYKAGERARAVIYSAASEGLIQQLKGMVTAGDSSAVQRLIAEKKIRSEHGLFEKTDRPVFAAVSWSPGVYTTKNKDVYYLVSVSAILPPGQRSFDEARGSVISDYQAFLEQQWLSALQRKYRVKINKKGRQYVERQLLQTTN